MRSTQITTHETDALNRLLYQYKDKSNIESLIKDICATQIQDLENVLFQLFSRLDIDASVGVQLDNIGEIVGQSRSGLSDTVYRLFLKARIGANVSEGDIPRVIDVWKLITRSNIVELREVYPAEVDLYYDVPLDTDLIDLAFALIQKVVGAGILVGFIAVFFNGNAFTCDGEVVGNDGEIDPLLGFGSALSQGSNTSISANKLIDSGATFLTDSVDNTMLVYNTSDENKADIVSVDSEIQLTLDADIFTATPKEYYVNENTGGKLSYLQAAGYDFAIISSFWIDDLGNRIIHSPGGYILV
jgi:hypothetical protein